MSDLGLPRLQPFRGFLGFGVFLDLLICFWPFLFFGLAKKKRGAHIHILKAALEWSRHAPQGSFWLLKLERDAQNM